VGDGEAGRRGDGGTRRKDHVTETRHRIAPSPTLPVPHSPHLPLSPSPTLPVPHSPRLPLSPSPPLPISPSPISDSPPSLTLPNKKGHSNERPFNG
jgi:hypothetical protein